MDSTIQASAHSYTLPLQSYKYLCTQRDVGILFGFRIVLRYLSPASDRPHRSGVRILRLDAVDDDNNCEEDDDDDDHGL